MKKLNVLLMVVIVFLAGCVSFEIGNTEKKLVAKIAARHVGFELEKRYPDIAVEVLALSEGLLVAEEDEIIKVILNRIVFVLTSEIINDPLLIMDIQDLIGLIEIKMDIELTEDQMAIIKAVAGGLIEGINLH
ncbi:hypothetical protein KAX02_02760 [candidate division WOR-3 bacterium]|nr:hypothetical protein [candidate division WOR-3 bacterium]